MSCLLDSVPLSLIINVASGDRQSFMEVVTTA